jgi:hypothetical protein
MVTASTDSQSLTGPHPPRARRRPPRRPTPTQQRCGGRRKQRAAGVGHQQQPTRDPSATECGRGGDRRTDLLQHEDQEEGGKDDVGTEPLENGRIRPEQHADEGADQPARPLRHGRAQQPGVVEPAATAVGHDERGVDQGLRLQGAPEPAAGQAVVEGDAPSPGNGR